MLICSHHGHQQHRGCALQRRITDALLAAMRSGDRVAIFLADQNDPSHYALATTGLTTELEQDVAKAFRLGAVYSKDARDQL
jgi:hypothetical protein